MILRIIGLFALYFVLNTVLKLPFDKEILCQKTMPAFLACAARYATIIFGIIGIYPNVFPMLVDLAGKGKDPIPADISVRLNPDKDSAGAFHFLTIRGWCLQTSMDIWCNEGKRPNSRICCSAFTKCAGHGTILAGESPATGIGEQVCKS